MKERYAKELDGVGGGGKIQSSVQTSKISNFHQDKMLFHIDERLPIQPFEEKDIPEGCMVISICS